MTEARKCGDLADDRTGGVLDDQRCSRRSLKTRIALVAVRARWPIWFHDTSVSLALHFGVLSATLRM